MRRNKKTILAFAGVAILMLTLVILIAFSQNESPSSTPSASGEIMVASVSQTSVVTASDRVRATQTLAPSGPTRTPTPTRVPTIDRSTIPMIVEFSDTLYVAPGQFEDRVAVDGYKTYLQTNGCGGPDKALYFTTDQTKFAWIPSIGDQNSYAGLVRLNRAECKMEIFYVYPASLSDRKGYEGGSEVTITSIDPENNRIVFPKAYMEYVTTSKTIYITYDGKPIIPGDRVKIGKVLKIGELDGKTQTYSEVLWVLRADFEEKARKDAGLE